MIVHAEYQQKNGGDPTTAWINARTGCLTASEFKEFVDLSGKLRTGEMPKTYLAEKLFERWTGRQKPNNFFTVDVNNGIIVEEKAAAFAALEYGLEIKHVGFVSNDDGTVGASPDGLIGWGHLEKDKPTFKKNLNVGETGIEIKSPALCTHIKYLMDGKLPNDYVCQVQGSMFVTGCQGWHFLSYPLICYLDGFPPLHLVIERDEKWQANFSESAENFLEKYDAEFEKLVKLNGGLPKQKHRGLESLGEETKTTGADYLAGA
jgi:hypothetical protein